MTNRFIYCLHVRTFLTFAAPSWFPSTCFPCEEFSNAGMAQSKTYEPWSNQSPRCPSWTSWLLGHSRDPRSARAVLEPGGLDAESASWGTGGTPMLTRLFFQTQRRFSFGIFGHISIPRVVPVAVTVIPPLVSSTIISPIRVPPIVVTIVSPVSLCSQ